MKEKMAKKLLLLLAGMILLILFLFAGCSKSGGTEVEIPPSTPAESNEIEEAEKEASEFPGVMTYLSYDFTDARNGYAIVKNPSGLLYGLVDKNGNQVIEFKYDDLKFLDIPGKNYLQAEYEGTHALIDCDGTEIISFDKGNFRVVNENLILRVYEYDLSGNGEVQIDRDRHGVEIFDVNGKKLGEYHTYQEHPTQGEFSTLDFKDAGGAVFTVSGAASNTTGNFIQVEFYFADVIKADGTVIESRLFPDVHLIAIAAQNPSNHTYSLSLTEQAITVLSNPSDGTEILTFNESGEILNRSTEEYQILGWTHNGYPLVCYDRSYYRLIDLDSGNELRYYDSKPEIQMSDSLCIIGNDVFNRDGEILFVAPGDPILLNDKVLYTTGTIKLVDANNEPVMDDRYFGRFSLEDNGHQAYFLENGDGEVLLLSETGEVLADYGIFTMGGSSEDPTFYFNGMSIQDYRLTDESLTLWFYDSYMTFFYE